jgi:hypothetical protein
MGGGVKRSFLENFRVSSQDHLKKLGAPCLFPPSPEEEELWHGLVKGMNTELSQCVN